MYAGIAFRAALLALCFSGLHAQIPQLINYQGRVAVSGANFNGTGQFRFALVNAAGTTTHWSNDGTSVNGAQPTSAVSLAVANGLYSVLLGDATLGNMIPIPAAVFTNADVRLRVWFNDGSHGSQLMTPDQRIAAVGYAVIAGGVPAGAITSGMIGAGAVQSANLAIGAVGGSQLANGSVGGAQLGSGAIAGNLNAGGQSGVGSGGIILSPLENPALVAAGYVRIGTTTLSDSWQQRVDITVPSLRIIHTAVWTGSEMIIWGGQHGGFALNDGRRYDPVTNSWRVVSPTNAPTSRNFHTAVWTGSEMIIWGGDNLEFQLGDGGRYNPISDRWTTVALAGAPAVRASHTAVWTGSEMIVWGGFGSVALADGGRYNPTNDLWGPPLLGSALNAPSARSAHTAVWTGSEMIIWGGNSGVADLGTGARFNPSASTWSLVATGGAAPSARRFPTAVWTGSEMIVWGGRDGSSYFADGGRYSPSADTWANVTSIGAPLGRTTHTAVWTGAEMMVWGGLNSISHTTYGDGGRYNASSASWTAIPAANAPSARNYHSAIWSGTEMIVWGGHSSVGDFGDGGRFNPALGTWASVATSITPGVRSGHSAVWTGSEKIVWGGYDGTTYLGDGARFNPALNRWAALATAGSPTGREFHTAVWTGSEMIVWGGLNPSYLNDGARYSPLANAWTAITPINAPPARYYHTAVWTGMEMIVWGGSGNTGDLNDGGRFNPAASAANAWTAVTLSGAPVGRFLHSAVWTGTEMIVWGGKLGATPLGDGGRYNPAAVANAWTLIAPGGGAPGARQLHSAVWTGSEMIVWGGLGASPFNDGSRYNPASSPATAWTTLPTSGSPIARYSHTATWTGSDMIVWGGHGSVNSALNDGARFNRTTNSWTAVSNVGAPLGRQLHTAIWTGSEMIVFGGDAVVTWLNDTWSYTPGQTLYLYRRP